MYIYSIYVQGENEPEYLTDIHLVLAHAPVPEIKVDRAALRCMRKEVSALMVPAKKEREMIVSPAPAHRPRVLSDTLLPRGG
jgi:hypothetical protein